MNNSINNVILFICSNSNASVEPLNLIKYYQIPIQIVKLDTQKARNKVKKGKFFQITSVPSLVVLYQDGTLQMFIGKEKIINWIQQLIDAKSKPSTPVYEQNEEMETTLDNDYIPKKHKRSKRSKRSKKRKPRKPKNLEYSSSEEEEDDDYIVVETYDNNDINTDPYNSNLSVHQPPNKAKDKMVDIKQIAEQMKRDRENTWMYAENQNMQ